MSLHLHHSHGKVMFSQASVILFTCGVSGRNPPGKTHPLGQTPPGRHFLGRHFLGRHPLGRHPPGQTPPCADPLPQQTATAADSMHSTGMRSCLPDECFKCNHFIPLLFVFRERLDISKGK